MEKLNSYLGFIYPGTLILFIVLYMIWLGIKLRQKKSIGMNVFLFIGLLIYLISFYKNYGLQAFMVFWLIRDAIFVFIIYLLMKFTFKNKTLVIVVVLGTCAIFGYRYYKYGKLPFSSPEVTAFESDKFAELLIDVKDKNRIGEITRLLEPWQAKVQLAFPQIADTAITDLDDYYTVEIKMAGDTAAIFDKLERSGLVDDAELNEVYTLSPVEMPNANLDKFIVAQDTGRVESNDSLLRTVRDSISNAKQQLKAYTGKALNDPRISSLWAFNYMEIDSLLSFLKNNKPVKKARIFILDTGVDALHEDLSGNYISILANYDTDTDKHGTHCAGIACAMSNNNLGIASLNLTGEFTSITSITVLPGGSGRQENIIDGIILAADNGADVISMSLGGAATDKRQRAYEKAIKYANDKGAIVVVAAGNENTNAKYAVPASCKGVITVAAVDDSLKRAVFSNFVSEIEYKVCAPGVNIFSTIPGNNYQFLNGTSMATPYVSALVGIMKAYKPDLSTAEVYKILNESGRVTRETEKTGRFIQPLSALKSIGTNGTISAVNGFLGKLLQFKPERR
jgi:thermitase